MSLPKIFTSIHNAVNSAVANRLMIRDVNGCVKASSPLADDDVALKSTVDSALVEFDKKKTVMMDHILFMKLKLCKLLHLMVDQQLILGTWRIWIYQI